MRSSFTSPGPVILPVVALAAVGTMFIVGMGVRAMRSATHDRQRGNDRSIGVAKTALAPHGQLAVHGELWEAVSEQPLQPGDQAEVTTHGRAYGCTSNLVLQKEEA